MLRESLGDDLVQLVVFVSTEKPQPSAAFFPLANKARGIDPHLPIAYSFPVAEIQSESWPNGQIPVRIEPTSRGAGEAKPPVRAFAQRGTLFAFLG
jgi:hypothetical protein